MTTRTGEVRIAHCRFEKNGSNGKKWESLYRKDRFDRVVSIVWSFDNETRLLTYGATVYKKEGPSDFWVKKEHREKALERYHNNPVRVKLITVGNTGNIYRNQDIYLLKRAAIDWYIALELIYLYGVSNKYKDTKTKLIAHNFNKDYDIFYDRVIEKRLMKHQKYEPYTNKSIRDLDQSDNYNLKSMSVVGLFLGLGWAYYFLASRIF